MKLFGSDILGVKQSLLTHDQLYYYQKAVEDFKSGISLEMHIHEDGHLISINYLEKGATHREDKPARRVWFENGVLRCEAYFENNKCHRISEPAYTEWREDGSLSQERYRIKGHLHRLPSEGPAFILYKDGLQTHVYYWEGIKVQHDFVPPELLPIPDGLGRIFI